MAAPSHKTTIERNKLLNALPDKFALIDAMHSKERIQNTPDLFHRFRHGWYEKVGNWPLPETIEDVRKCRRLKHKKYI